MGVALESSNVEKGVDYENFVRSVYESILAQDNVKTIDVKHNVSVDGKSGCRHQIDVYWEFKLAGKLYRTAIECKNFSSEVPIGRIRDFYGVLIDVPNLTGIFATKVGYQSGARKYAEHYGIDLKELREPTDSDWVGRVRDIDLNFHVVSIEIRRFVPRPTPAFLATIPEGLEIRIAGGFSTHEPIIFDPAGSRAVSWNDIRQNLPHGTDPLRNQAYFASYPNYRLRIGGMDVEIEGIDIVYDVEILTEKTRLWGRKLIQAIVKDANTGDLIAVRNRFRSQQRNVDE